MPRWPADEEAQLVQMRRLLSREPTFLANSRPDVVGDRRMLRFLRGQDHNVELATAKFKSFLLWREANSVDFIRDDILFSGRIQSPFDFPGGSKILRLVPQIVIAHNALDRSGNPLAMEMFNFSPSEVLGAVSKEEYSLFMIYLLEYRSLVLEQMSCEAEERLKRSPGIEQLIHMDASGITYGVLLSCLIIRDFEGLGLHHVSGDGQTVLKLILEIAVANYPEQQYRCHMVNLPWFFNSVWFVLRNMFDKRMLSKLTMSGGPQEYTKKLLLDIDVENIPAKLGGRYTGYNPPYSFNLSVDGPFYYPSCPHMNAQKEMPPEIIDHQDGLGSVGSEAAAMVSPMHDMASAVAAAEEEDCRTEAGDQEEGVPVESDPGHSEAEAAKAAPSVSFASDHSIDGQAPSPMSRRSRGFKMKHIMRLFSPSQQLDSSSKGSPSLPPSTPSPLPSPSPCASPSTAQSQPRRGGGASTAALRDGAGASYRSDLETTTTLPSDGSSDPVWSDRSALRRPSRSHRRESSLSSLESSALLHSSPIEGEFGPHSQRHRSSRSSSNRASKVLSPSERRRSSSKRHSQHSSSREEKDANPSPTRAASTVTVGLSGRDFMERDAVQQPRAKVKAPKPGESIEHWKARVSYSSADAAASDDLHRQCYSCFASIDNGNSTDGGSFWICF